MATTTYTAIANVLETTINAVTPTSLTGVPFQRGLRNVDLRDWAVEENASSAISRTWQLESEGSSKPEFQGNDQADLTHLVTLVVAYWAPQFRGPQDLDDVEDIVRADAILLHDALHSPGILIAGWNAVFIDEIPGPDREAGDVWFQEIPLTLRYYIAQSLT